MLYLTCGGLLLSLLTLTNHIVPITPGTRFHVCTLRIASFISGVSKCSGVLLIVFATYVDGKGADILIFLRISKDNSDSKGNKLQ